MNLGLEDKKKLAILSVAGVGALGAAVYLYTELFPPTPPPVVAPTASSSPAATPAGSSSASGNSTTRSDKPIATTAASLDPALHMDPMLTAEALVYQGSGRNIFSTMANTVPAGLPKPVASARTHQGLAAYTPPPGPPPPPRIDLHFFGTAAAAGKPIRAFLIHGEDVFLASAGDIVNRRYKVISVGATAVVIQDLSNNNQQSIALTSN